MHVDSAEELPRRICMADQEKDKVGISVSSMYNIEQSKYQQSDDKKAMVMCLEQDMKETNESICRNIEDVLFDERYVKQIEFGFTRSILTEVPRCGIFPKLLTDFPSSKSLLRVVAGFKAYPTEGC